MGTTLKLLNTELLEFANDLVREYYGISPFCQIKLINSGDSVNYSVQDYATGSDTILRVTRSETQSCQAIKSELLWRTEILKDSQLAIPKPILGTNGEYIQIIPNPHGKNPLLGVMFSHIRGTVPPETEDVNVLSSYYSKLGESAALLHQNVILWSNAAKLSRHTLDEQTILGEHSVFSHLTDTQLPAAYTELFSKSAQLIRERLRHFGRPSDRYGLIHANLRPSSLILDNGRTAIDYFDRCCYSWFLYDFGASVSTFENKPYFNDLMSAWLDGYRMHRKISNEEAREIPTFVLLNRLKQMAQMISDPLNESGVTNDIIEQTAILAENYLSKVT